MEKEKAIPKTDGRTSRRTDYARTYKPATSLEICYDNIDTV